MPKRSRSGEVSSPARVVAPTRVNGRPDQGECGQVELDRARRRPLADHDVELVVLHRGVEDLLHHRAEAVDLVDEEDIAGVEVGQERRQVARLLQHRARGLAEIHAHLVGDDVGEGGLTEPGRAEDQHVIQGVPAPAGGVNEDLHLLAHRGLTHVLGEPPRPDGAVDGTVLVTGLGADQALGVGHRGGVGRWSGGSSDYRRSAESERLAVATGRTGRPALDPSPPPDAVAAFDSGPRVRSPKK